MVFGSSAAKWHRFTGNLAERSPIEAATTISTCNQVMVDSVNNQLTNKLKTKMTHQTTKLAKESKVSQSKAKKASNCVCAYVHMIYVMYIVHISYMFLWFYPSIQNYKMNSYMSHICHHTTFVILCEHTTLITTVSKCEHQEKTNELQMSDVTSPLTASPGKWHSLAPWLSSQ